MFFLPLSCKHGTHARRADVFLLLTTHLCLLALKAWYFTKDFSLKDFFLLIGQLMISKHWLSLLELVFIGSLL